MDGDDVPRWLLLPECERPTADRFVAERAASAGHHVFNISKTQREPEGEPYRMGDDFSGKALSFVGWCCTVCLHALSIAYVPRVSADDSLP